MAKAIVPGPHRRRAGTLAIRLSDVARAAEVSTATASRALASPDLVSAALRERVGAAAARLGYAPNYAARALASHRSRLIGAIVSTVDGPLLGPALAAFERRLAGDGQALVLTTTDDGSMRAGVCARTLVSLGVDALILFGVTSSPELERWRSAHGRPWLFVNAPGAHNALSLGSTKQRGMVLAARYLQHLGHRRLLMLGDDAPGLAESARTELGSAEAQLIARDCAGALRGGESARTVLRDALSSPVAPTAVICSSDALAALAVRECGTRAVRIPEQVSIVGFGDTSLARMLWPALTTVRIPLEEIGRRLADAVLAELDGQPLPPIEFPVRLVLRESSGPPPRQGST